MLHQLSRSRFSLSTLLLLIIFLDQSSKAIAYKVLDPAVDLPIFADLIRFTLVFNHDGFLGILNGTTESVRFILLVIVVALTLGCCLAWLFCYPNALQSRYLFQMIFIVAGGTGNLLDRLLHNGGVIDFISLGVASFRTGIFNLADLFVLFGSFGIGHCLVSGK